MFIASLILNLNRSHEHDDGVLGEIREIIEPNKMPPAQRAVQLPLLWRFRTPIPMALDHLKTYFLSNPAHTTQYLFTPVLYITKNF